MAEIKNETAKKVTKLETRIQNKLDSLDNWNNSSIELLSGEIAIVKTPEEPTYGDTNETRSTPTVAMKIGELDEKGKPKPFKDLPWVSDRTAIHQGGSLTKGLRLGNTADGAIKDSTGQNTVLGIDENNNLNFGSTNYSTQIKGKYSRPKYVTLENNEGQDLALFDDLSTVAKTGNFNDLNNLPFYPSIVDISWDGNTTGKTATMSSPVSDAGGTFQFSFYKVSDKVVTSDEVIGANVLFDCDGEETHSVLIENILFGDGKDSGSFYISYESVNYIPLIFCVQKPETFTKTLDGIGTVSITFEETGIYFINLEGMYVLSFSKKGKTLDKEFIPDIYQEKLSCPQLDMGNCGSDSTGNFIYNYIYLANNISNPNADLQKLAYNITTDSFVLPIIMNTTLNPTNGTITLKVVTGVGSSGNPSDSISIDISCKTPLYSEKTYFLVAFKKSDGTWSGWIVGKTDSPVDTSPTSGSENLITSGGVYTATENIKESLATVATTGSYNDLKNLPCYEKDPSLYFNNIYWAGDISSATLGAEADIDGMHLQWYKVSDTIISSAKALPGCLVTSSDGNDVIIHNDDPDMLVRTCSDKGSVQAGFFVISIAQNNDTVSISYGGETEISLTFAEAGTYFAYGSSDGEITFVQSLFYNSNVKLPEGLLPNNIRDYESLHNKPFDTSIASAYIGDPEVGASSVTTTNTIETLGTSLSYYRVSTQPHVLDLKNIKSLDIDIDGTMEHFSIDQSCIKYSDDLNSRSYAIFVGGLPFVYAIQQPAETVTITFDEIGEVTATFPEAGFYFLKYTATEGEIQHTKYAEILAYEEITKIDNKYLPINTIISSTSTDDTIPSSKAIYDFVQSTINESVIAALERSY